jgi:hypothetical protein
MQISSTRPYFGSSAPELVHKAILHTSPQVIENPLKVVAPYGKSLISQAVSTVIILPGVISSTIGAGFIATGAAFKEAAHIIMEHGYGLFHQTATSFAQTGQQALTTGIIMTPLSLLATFLLLPVARKFKLRYATKIVQQTPVK